MWVELNIYLFLQTQEISKGLFGGLGSIIIFGTIVILLVQVVSDNRFEKQIKEIVKNEKEFTTEKNLKIGRLLINEKFILYYGMFRKRVIPISQIVKAEYQEYSVRKNTGRWGYISYSGNYIFLIREGKRRIELRAPKNYLGEEGKAITNSINAVVSGKKIRESTIEYYKEYDADFPFYAVLTVILFGILLLLIILYPFIKDVFVANDNKIETMLYCVAFEGRFQIFLMLLFICFVIGAYVWKHFYLWVDDFSEIFSNIFLYIILAISFFVVELPWNFSTYKEGFQEDYFDYKNGRYETVETDLILMETEGWGWHEGMQEMVERYDIRIDECYSSQMKRDFYLVDKIVEINRDATYQIKYLTNSGIIVEIQEVD